MTAKSWAMLNQRQKRWIVNLSSNIFRLWVIFASILLASGSIIFVLFESRGSSQFYFETGVFNYGIDAVARFLRHNGMNIDNFDDVRRDAFGKTLFIFLNQDPAYHNLMIAVSSNTVRAVNYPGRRAFPVMGGGFAAWFDETGTTVHTKTVHFKGGESLSLGRFDLFDVDPSGEYFIIGEKPTTTWLGRISSPEQRVVISTDVLGDHVFANGTSICVCGNSYERRANGTYLSSAVYITAIDHGGKFRMQERHTFKWASGIVDVDRTLERILLWDKMDWFNSVYVYNLKTEKRQRIGFAKHFQFFLVGDLLKARRIANGITPAP